MSWRGARVSGAGGHGARGPSWPPMKPVRTSAAGQRPDSRQFPSLPDKVVSPRLNCRGIVSVIVPVSEAAAQDVVTKGQISS